MDLSEVGLIFTAIGDRSPEELVAAANLTLKFSGAEGTLTDPSQADVILRALLQGFLDADNYLFAARLLWSVDLFDIRPQYARDIFEFIPPRNQILLCGATSVSKTYSAAGWLYLDWRRDPEYTTIKVAAVNEEHLKRNCFAHILALHRRASIPLQARESEMYLGLESAGADFGFAGVLFPQGADPTSRIRGYKPKPYRKTRHPRFGLMTRVRFLGDEGQSWKDGLFADIGSLQSSMDGPDPVKIIISFNPNSRETPVVRKAQPVEDWRIEEIDTLYRWTSKEGWDVLRLDGLRCENVVQKKTIYPGIITYEAAMKFIKGGGDTSSDYFEKLRGFPPIKSAQNTIIPSAYPAESRGEAIFVERPVPCGALDCAYQGEDSAVLAVGRYGLASGWVKSNGDRVVYMNPLNPAEALPRHVLQYDQLIPLLEKEDTVVLAQEAREKARQLGIEPNFFAIDGTGNGFGTYSHLKHYWGPVLLIQWGQKATDRRVLNEDILNANQVYDNIISEMWFTVRRWFESGAIIISNNIETQPINNQLSSRRYARVRGGLMRAESKLEYKSRGNPSPDEADSFIELPFLIRSRHEILPGIQVESKSAEETEKEADEKTDIEPPDYLDELSSTEHAEYLE
jgi:hypothetical protein